jgi:hypothetical protein
MKMSVRELHDVFNLSSLVRLAICLGSHFQPPQSLLINQNEMQMATTNRTSVGSGWQIVN